MYPVRAYNYPLKYSLLGETECCREAPTLVPLTLTPSEFSLNDQNVPHLQLITVSEIIQACYEVKDKIETTLLKKMFSSLALDKPT